MARKPIDLGPGFTSTEAPAPAPAPASGDTPPAELPPATPPPDLGPGFDVAPSGEPVAGGYNILGMNVGPQAPQTWADYGREKLSAGVKGAVALPSLLLDKAMTTSTPALVANQMTSLLGLPTSAPPTLADITTKGLEAVGLPGEPPATLGNNVAGAIGGTVGMGLGAGALRATMGEAGLEAAPAIDRLTRALTTKPGVQLAGAVGGGVGETVSQDSPHAIVRLGVPVLGGLIGAGAAGGVEAGARALFGKDVLARSAVIRTLLGNASDAGGVGSTILDYTADPADPLAKFRSTAEVTGDPGLLQTERTLRSKPGGEDFAVRNAQRQTARTSILDEIAPPEGPGAPDIKAAYERTAADEAASREQTLATATQNRDQAVTGIGTPALPEQAGAATRQQLVERMQNSSAEVGKLLDAVDPEGLSQIRTKPIKDAITAAAQREYGSDESLWPVDVQMKVGALRGRFATQYMTFDDLQAARASLRRAGENWGQAADRNWAKVQNDASEAIRGHLENLGSGEAGLGSGGGSYFPPHMLDRWNQFRQAAQTHAQNFGSDPAVDIAATRAGMPEMGPTTIMGQFFKPGETGGNSMQDWARAFRNADGTLDPAAVSNMRQYIAGRVAEMMGPDGTVNPTALARFVANHRAALRQVPDIAADLRNADTAAQAVKAAGAVPPPATDAGAKVASMFLGSDANVAVRSALNSPDRTANLTALWQKLAPTPEGQQAVKRAILDDLQQTMQTTKPAGAAGDELMQSQSAAERWFAKHSGPLTASGIFTPDEMNRLNIVRRDMFSAQRPLEFGRATGSPTMQLANNGQVIDALLQGRAVPEWVQPLVNKALAGAQGSWGVKSLMNLTGDRARTLLMEAAMDPQTFQLMLRKADPVTLDRLTGRLSGINYAGIAGRAAPGAVSTSVRLPPPQQ